MIPSYAAIGIYAPGQTKPRLMSANGKVIVFDHATIAREWMPRLGGEGRMTHWIDKDNAFWTPIQANSVGRATVITDYDPYNLPAGLPVLSESKGIEWRNHVYWAHVFYDCGQFVERKDGTYYNSALTNE